MSPSEINKKAPYLTSIINKQIAMTDSNEELVLLAVLMLNKARDILDNNRSEEVRKRLFKEFA